MGIVFWDSFRRWRAHSTKILIRVARTDRSAIVGSEHRWCVQLGASNRGILQLTQYSTDCLQGMNPCAVSQSSLSKYNFNHIWTAHQQEKKKKKKLMVTLFPRCTFTISQIISSIPSALNDTWTRHRFLLTAAYSKKVKQRKYLELRRIPINLKPF
jgi:hypothetical protein